MTDLLGTPPPECISRIRNEKARRYLSNMRKKQRVPFKEKFPTADPLALRLLERLLAFDPKDRPTAEEALADPYFRGLANADHELSTQPISKFEFEFERRKVTKEDVRELIYKEILEYHPQMLEEYLHGGEQTSTFMYPSGVDRFKQQFAHLEDHYSRGERSTPLQRQHASLPRQKIPVPAEEPELEKRTSTSTSPLGETSDASNGSKQSEQQSGRSLLKSASISASKCVGVKPAQTIEDEGIREQGNQEDDLNCVSEEVSALHHA